MADFSQSSANRKYLSDDEIAEVARKLRIADPNKDNGVFNSVTRMEALIWLKCMGVSGLSPPEARALSDEEVIEKLRYALWDSQRIDNLFHGKTYLTSSKLDVTTFPVWPNWEKEKTELKSNMIGAMQMDGFKDAKRMDSYVFRHFATSAFTQMENMSNAAYTAPSDITGAWMGTKATMSKAALDITREGGNDTLFVTYFTDNDHLLLMEILDVKQCAWPEPSDKLMKQLKTAQESKFGHPADGPLVPMMQTPKFPLVLVRYSYMEGRPKGGSQFTLFLESKIKKSMPRASAKQVREKLQYHMQCGEKVPEAHLRMFARLLSYNSELLDPAYSEDLQSHWNGISQAAIKETRISFFVPCLRLRWRVLEEIETGVSIQQLGTTCQACGKIANKLMCNSCKSVYYCNAECNKADWPRHKEVCKTSKRLLDDPSSFPSDRLYIPARTYVDLTLDFGFAVDQEAIKYSGGTDVGDSIRNEYGDERFLLRTQMPPDYSHEGGKYKGQSIFCFDRRRSIMVRTSPGDPPMARERGWPLRIPFHPEGHKRYTQVIKTKGIQGQLIYLWAKRVGDAVEIDLVDVPDQRKISWN
ncbi:uncharacterized protein EV420DRAFT_1539644 [Desarmillaria tabescens]|uniref:MYND-type domain-containing protein n=1 Tax=Armillaria tabescens TaxID=1929756 RepID=A0AA39N6Q8_ARMTA|nr:uncharacterized protein EV420DRAFT_1539644 [Desarmillaria tabescens]KAK0459335.1 hypothetical protein EV420DRAFT_1539644 [Desarmillaria tabescens]